MPYLNEDLVGIPGGRRKIQTPALVIDLNAFERNLARMTAHAHAAKIKLRPHAKTQTHRDRPDSGNDRNDDQRDRIRGFH